MVRLSTKMENPNRWHDILEEEPVFSRRTDSEPPTWAGHTCEVRRVVVGEDDIRAHFSFVAKGVDENSHATEDEITGSAVAAIDERDGVEFHDIEARECVLMPHDHRTNSRRIRSSPGAA